MLGEKPSEHRFIVTAPGRGYRFVAAVRACGEVREAEADGLSLAVLPCPGGATSESPLTPHALGKGYLGEAIAADLPADRHATGAHVGADRDPLSRAVAQCGNFGGGSEMPGAGNLPVRMYATMNS